MNMKKCSSIDRVIKNFRKSITTNINVTEITSCLEKLIWTLNSQRVLFITEDVSAYLVNTLFLLKNVIPESFFFNVQDNLNNNICRLVSMTIDNLLLLTLENTTDDLEIASQISMIIESYVHGDQNAFKVFRNSKHISDQLMAINHSTILSILKQRFSQCFPNLIDNITPQGTTSIDLNKSFCDQLNFTTYEVLTDDEINDQVNTVPMCNMSYDELIMYMDAPNGVDTDIPWLKSLQTRAQSKIIKKKNFHTFSSEAFLDESTNLKVPFESKVSIIEPTTEKRRKTTDLFKTVESQVSIDSNKVNMLKRRATVDAKYKDKSSLNTKVYCWECHLIITKNAQYFCLQCHRSFHKICFKTVDLVCMDCEMLMRMHNDDPESLALILNATMKNVLQSESSYFLGKKKMSMNLLYISLKVELGNYKNILDFLRDFKIILHSCSINKKLLHLKQHAKIIMEIVVKDLRKVAVSRM